MNLPPIFPGEKTPGAWKERRTELLRLLSEYEYGFTPELRLTGTSCTTPWTWTLASGVRVETHRLFFEKDGAVCEMTLVVPVVAQLPYALYDRVRRMCEDAGGRVTEQLFAEDVQLSCLFRAGEEAAFVDAVRELAAGEELARAGEPRFAEF